MNDRKTAEHVEAAGIAADLMQAGYRMAWRELRSKARKAFFTDPGARWSFTYDPARGQWRIWDKTGQLPTRGMETADFSSAASGYTKRQETTSND